jgi:hypothetical protein
MFLNIAWMSVIRFFALFASSAAVALKWFQPYHVRFLVGAILANKAPQLDSNSLITALTRKTYR